MAVLRDTKTVAPMGAWMAEKKVVRLVDGMVDRLVVSSVMK
jgi:hypothetical protein